MNKKPAIGFAILTAVVILTACVSIVVRVMIGEAQGREAARGDFSRLEASLRDLKTSAGLADPALREKLRSHYAANNRLLFASIYERDGGLRYLIPASTPYVDPSSSLRPKPEYPERSAILLSSVLPGDGTGRLILDALYVALPQGRVFAAFRDAAIGIGAYLIVSALLFLLAFGGSKKEEVWTATARDLPGNDADKNASGAAGAAAGGLENEGMEGEAEFSPLSDAESEECLREECLDEFTIPDISPDLSEDEGISLSHVETASETAPRTEIRSEEPEDLELSLPEAECADESKEACEAPDEPTGLFSPRSGLGWEPYLLERLDAELSRSASFEHELCLLLIQYTGLLPDSPAYKDIAKAIQEFFSFRDLAFELGEDGFAVILPNVDLDHAIRQAEDFLKASGYGAQEGSSMPFLGASSRSGRLVEAKRVLKEAQAALERAKADPDSRIIAFRPDPEKYRKYLSTRR